MNLSDLEKIDDLQQISYGKHECFLHKDHRWVLPIIFHKQQKKALPHPCTLVIFDAHHDTLPPSCMEDILLIKEVGINFDKLVNLCQEKLKDDDDDWIITGMELGLIDNAVIFGVEDRVNNRITETFKDHQGKSHYIKLLGFPREELGDRGDLRDISRLEDLSGLWEILGWQCNHQFSFAQDRKKILLDFDLDCFIIQWKCYRFPWPDEVFIKEFLKPSNHRTKLRWTGKGFLDGLINKAALITIAREPVFCGGDTKANQVLSKVNHFLFDDKLLI